MNLPYDQYLQKYKTIREPIGKWESATVFIDGEEVGQAKQIEAWKDTDLNPMYSIYQFAGVEDPSSVEPMEWVPCRARHCFACIFDCISDMFLAKSERGFDLVLDNGEEFQDCFVCGEGPKTSGVFMVHFRPIKTKKINKKEKIGGA